MTDRESRRAGIVSDVQAETGIDDSVIHAMVHGFYARVREDALLGPVFEARIDDWGPHLERMCAFWSSVALMSGRYNGRPMDRHLPLPIDARHFDRWLELFEATARELCAPSAAQHFIFRARRIAESLELGIASARGVLLMKGQRLRWPELDAPGSDPV